MRVVGRPHDAVRAECVECVRQVILALGRDEHTTLGEVLARCLGDVRELVRAVLVVLVEAFEVVRRPADAGLEQRHA